MERTAITMDGCGRIAVPSDAANVWMNEMELVRLFDVIACRHPSRVQKRSAEALRCGKAHQASQRLLCGGVCPANGRGNRFPYQHTQCRKGTQRPVGKAVLAKRQTSAIFLFVAKCFVNGFVERLFRSYITEHLPEYGMVICMSAIYYFDELMKVYINIKNNSGLHPHQTLNKRIWLMKRENGHSLTHRFSFDKRFDERMLSMYRYDF